MTLAQQHTECIVAFVLQQCLHERNSLLRYTLLTVLCNILEGCRYTRLLTQYYAGDKIETKEMGWACGAYGWGEEGGYRVLVWKPEGKRPLGRPRRRWVDNIRMDLQEVGCGYLDWIGLALDRDRWRTLVSAVMNLRVPWNFLTSWKPVSFSRRTLHHGGSK